MVISSLSPFLPLLGYPCLKRNVRGIRAETINLAPIHDIVGNQKNLPKPYTDNV